MRIQGIVAVGLFSACGGHAPKAACVPAATDVAPTRLTLTGARLTFCLSACFTADLDAKTIAPASAPSDASAGRSTANVIFDPGNGSVSSNGSIAPSAHGKGLTACTSDNATCHELAIDAASIGNKPFAVSGDATLVAIDTRNPHDVRKEPGRVETWDAVSGKKLATFDTRYGPDGLGMEEVPRHGILGFLGHTVIAFTEPGCALPCSSATMYSVRGTYLGMLAGDPTGSRAQRVHDDVYLLDSYGPQKLFVVQDAATGKTLQPDSAENWDAVVARDRIVRVVGRSGPRAPRVEVWGADLKLATTIVVPPCAP